MITWAGGAGIPKEGTVTALYPWLVFVHVLGAIIAFGPTFTFSLIGAAGGREPQHANFATRLSHRISDVVVEPFAIVTLLSGAAMIWVGGLPWLDRSGRWLLLSIVLYVIALGLALLVSRPAIKRIIELGSGGPGGPPTGGPPPELLAAAATVRRVGMVLTVLTVTVVFLMVMKPDLGV